jgi:hypothetical protein
MSGCAPDVVLEVETAAQMDGSTYTPPVTGGVYRLDEVIHFKALVSDADGPPTVIGLEWEVVPPCFGDCTPIPIGTTGVFAPNTSYLAWTPTDHLTPWSNCSQTPLPHVIRVTATDVNGNSRTATRTIYLACGFI